MSKHDALTTLRQMLDHAVELRDLMAAKTRASLDQERLLSLAVVRLLEIIGEAATRISAEGQTRFAGIEWRGIVGLRNRLVHGYDEVDLDRVWQIIVDDIPPLIAALEAVLKP
jgi:uncharacterized protein with HEPN domain